MKDLSSENILLSSYFFSNRKCPILPHIGIQKKLKIIPFIPETKSNLNHSQKIIQKSPEALQVIIKNPNFENKSSEKSKKLGPSLIFPKFFISRNKDSLDPKSAINFSKNEKFTESSTIKNRNFETDQRFERSPEIFFFYTYLYSHREKNFSGIRNSVKVKSSYGLMPENYFSKTRSKQKELLKNTRNQKTSSFSVGTGNFEKAQQFEKEKQNLLMTYQFYNISNENCKKSDTRLDSANLRNNEIETEIASSMYDQKAISKDRFLMKNLSEKDIETGTCQKIKQTKMEKSETSNKDDQKTSENITKSIFNPTKNDQEKNFYPLKKNLKNLKADKNSAGNHQKNENQKQNDSINFQKESSLLKKRDWKEQKESHLDPIELRVNNPHKILNSDAEYLQKMRDFEKYLTKHNFKKTDLTLIKLYKNTSTDKEKRKSKNNLPEQYTLKNLTEFLKNFLQNKNLTAESVRDLLLYEKMILNCFMQRKGYLPTGKFQLMTFGLLNNLQKQNTHKRQDENVKFILKKLFSSFKNDYEGLHYSFSLERKDSRQEIPGDNDKDLEKNGFYLYYFEETQKQLLKKKNRQKENLTVLETSENPTMKEIIKNFGEHNIKKNMKNFKNFASRIKISKKFTEMARVYLGGEYDSEDPQGIFFDVLKDIETKIKKKFSEYEKKLRSVTTSDYETWIFHIMNDILNNSKCKFPWSLLDVRRAIEDYRAFMQKLETPDEFGGK